MKVLEVQIKKIMTKSNLEEILELFNTYAALVEKRDSEEMNKFQEFVNKNSWSNDCGRRLIDASDLESFYKSLKKL
mgnify:CR=1 FL=1